MYFGLLDFSYAIQPKQKVLHRGLKCSVMQDVRIFGPTLNCKWMSKQFSPIRLSFIQITTKTKQLQCNVLARDNVTYIQS